VILALNKIDLLAEREKLLPLMAESMQRHPFHAIVPVSAEKGRQLEELLAEVRTLLPEGMPLFDAEQYTDRSARYSRRRLSARKPIDCWATSCLTGSRSPSIAGKRQRVGRGSWPRWWSSARLTRA